MLSILFSILLSAYGFLLVRCAIPGPYAKVLLRFIPRVAPGDV
jgi:hypothetical protein